MMDTKQETEEVYMDFAPVILGILVILLGVSNMKGNISTLHRYHRKRVKEEDRLPFGRMVGLGTIVVGFSVVVNGVCTLLAEQVQRDLFLTAGTVLMGIGFVAGFALILYALFKYNKGIF